MKRITMQSLVFALLIVILGAGVVGGAYYITPFTGIKIGAGGILSSGTNSFSGKTILSNGTGTWNGITPQLDNFLSGLSTTTWPGGLRTTGTTTLAGKTVITGDITSSGSSTFTGRTVITGNPKFSYTLSGNQTISSGVATKISVTTVIRDSASLCSGGTCTTSVVGDYLLAGTVMCRGTTVTECACAIYKNGALYKVSRYVGLATASYQSAPCPTIEVYASTSDYFEMWGTATGTGTMQVQAGDAGTVFSGVMIP